MNPIDSKDKVKVALVTNMIAPYRVSFYNELSRLCDLTVIVDAETEFNRAWKMDSSAFEFKKVLLNSSSIIVPRVRRDLGYREHRQLHFSQRLIPELMKLKPQVIVSNELGLRSLWCMIYSKLWNCSWILMSEATNHTEGWVGRCKRALRKLLISQADGFWSNGLETSQFLIDRGAIETAIMPDMTGIAIGEFRDQSRRFMEVRDVLRRSMELSGVVFLFVGRLESGKGLSALLKAIRLNQEMLQGKCSFLFVGGGSMREEMEIASSEIHGVTFRFVGFVQPEELPKFFAVGDIFVMPTLDDNWPLVNLEALAAGLPQIYSIYNGGAKDLNHVAGLGEAIDPNNIEMFGRRLVECVENLPPRIDGEAQTQALDHYSPRAQSERAIRSIQRVLPGENGD